VRGTGEPLLGLEYISNEVKVEPGERILTSGQDRIFPKDLPVGTVLQVQPDRHSPFLKISVKPAARLDGLEEVLVLLTRQEFNFRKDADKSVAVPVASAAPPKPATPATPPKAAAPVTPPKPAAPTPPPKPAVSTLPPKPKPAAPVAQPKPEAPATEPKPEAPVTEPAPETPDNP
jgi:rod shape-determining protein MreC